MAEKVIRVDDIDGSEGGDVAKRDFEILDRMFTIDLNDENYKRVTEALETLAVFIENSTEVKRAGRGRKTGGAAKVKGYTNAEVKEWAKQNGVEAPERGKIPDEIYAAFIEDHPDAKPET